VPELIDVWFDSGAMPYAQWHYPFENVDMFQRQYPADYICEAVDQTRGWFYSLHAIGTMLFESETFKNVICLGLILDSDGYKMSKSRGNIVDPWDVLNAHGADAFRWYLYTASPAGQERRFSVDLVGEVVRNFTLTLWNVYSFFVTYANLDRWTPASKAAEGASSLDEGAALDRWLRSELHSLVRDVTAALEAYDVTGATRPLQVFVDNLSKWYLRRSRRRFWKSGGDADKQSAYATLYEVLLTLSKLLAPTMPFLAEELYQNLARAVDPGAAESVHLSDWPAYDPAAIDERLNREMELAMKLASLGHAARNQAQIKVRQPLAEVAFSVSNQDEAQALQAYAGLLTDELNVKKVSLLGSAGEAVSYSLKPLPKQLGQKYKGLFPKVSQAILALDASVAGPALLSGASVRASVEGIALEIQPDEVEVRAEARQGLVVASEGAYLAALHTELTPELVEEGLAREFVRRVQDLRKQAEFDISDRIRLYLEASPALEAAIRKQQGYVLGETLTVEWLAARPEGGASSEAEFDGERVAFTIVKAA
jgi:isoleucyl-tRNA synthetase